MKEVTLKEHFEKILSEKDRYNEGMAREGAKALNIALTAAKDAQLKTEQAQHEYNKSHNDLLRKMDDQYKSMVPRSEYEAYKLSMEAALRVEKERADKTEGKGAGVQMFIGWIIAAIAIAAFFIQNIK